MPIIITDEDAERLLSIPEAIEAMRVAFRDLAEGARSIRRGCATAPARPIRRAATPPTSTPARSRAAGVACVRAGSAFSPVQAADGRKVTVADDVN